MSIDRAHIPIEFDAAAHQYRVAGQIIPSVTQILRPLVDFSAIAPDVLAAKADLGKRVHFACELDDDADLDESSVEDDVAPYLDAYRRWRRESGAQIILTERRLYHRALGYCGTLDRVAHVGGAAHLIDLKTSVEIYASTGPQTAAYAAALGAPVQHRAALQLRADGTYRYHALTSADDWPVFVACLTLHRFKQEHTSV